MDRLLNAIAAPQNPSASASDLNRLLKQTFDAFTSGRIDDAARIANLVLSTHPRAVEGHRIIGMCHRQAGRVDAAEAAFRIALKLDRANEAVVLDLADLLAATKREAAAETALRVALAANRRSIPLVVALARLLIARAKADESLRLMVGLPLPAARDHSVLTTTAEAHNALGRKDKALAAYRRAAELYPESAVAHHNLAATLGDLGRFDEAARSAARAVEKGGGVPETWLVFARALLGASRLGEAENAYRETIKRRPAFVEAHRELAQLIWMRSADQRAATSVLDAHILQYPQAHELFAIRASVLDHAGDTANAYATLQQAIRRHPEQASLHLSASQLAAKLEGGVGHAVDHAKRALSLLPGNHDAASALVAACLAAGEAKAASSAAALLLAQRPLDQRALAYQATAWRMLGDARHHALYDYANFVRAWRMDTPDGWPSLEAYLADLTQALGGLHPFRTHPLDQSVRHGSQATHLLASDNPVIRAFFQAVDGPIRRHLVALGAGDDPVRVRNVGAYRFHGAWSVRLRPGGFHTDHIHPQGWLSSACYIALPPMQGEGREAWIKFGQPGVPTTPALDAEHFIRPEPGMLVLFPSYMWHGTVPFSAGEPRLSVAFDLLPT